MGRSEPPPTQSTSTLDLSKSQAYDAALDILGAYKLTGNFHINLESVLKSLGAFDKVTFEVEPKAKLPYHPDCRHVVFRPSANLPLDRFGEIIRSIEARIGFDVARPGGSKTRPDITSVPVAARAGWPSTAKASSVRKPNLRQICKLCWMNWRG